MAKAYIDMNTLRFLLHDVHNLEQVLAAPTYQDHDKGAVDLFLDSVKDFADQELYPIFKEMDEKPAYFKDGKIVVHPKVGDLMLKGGEMGLIAAPIKAEAGGLQLPLMVHSAAYTILDAANNNVPGYWGLTLGSAELIIAFGNEMLNETYVPSMLEGKWAGTMCLTEPQAGSSLSDVATTAYPTEDGHYLLKGQKIFISGGDHEQSENFVHLVLARIQGAPAGTKGISLFVVPKLRPTENGLASNDVKTVGDFQKMGQRGYCTTHLMFGENEDCRGWLVGEPHKGLSYMFRMMNGARIAVGRGAAAIASAAYHAALEYAQERPQGRRVSEEGQKDVSQSQTLIINHADVRRMLLLQKAVAEGAISLILQASEYHDLAETSEDAAARKKFHTLLELLTPIVKTYPAEMGAVSVSNGVQVLGGYGFCTEYILQQYHRDIRIYSLYEGTTGIQSLDLLGRKIMMTAGQSVEMLAEEMKATIGQAKTHEDLKPYAKILGEKLALTKQVLEHLGGYAMQGEVERFLADATVFMEFFGTIVIGWQWLKMATEAKNALVTGKTTFQESFYESKVHTMRFFYKYEMNKTLGLSQVLMDENTLTIPVETEVLI